MTQTPAEGNGTVQAVTRVANGTDLYDIRTTGMEARLRRDAPEVSVPVNGGMGVTIRIQRDAHGFRLLTEFALNVHEDSKSENDAFFTAKLAIIASYRFREALEAADHELRAFAQLNGMLHLWPYFRTFVQQSSGQLSILPVVIPVFRAHTPFPVRFANA